MMKHAKRQLQVIICCFFLFWSGCSCAGTTEAGSWSFVGFTKYRDALFIDKANLSRKTAGKVLFAARIEPSPKSLLRRNIKQEIPQYKKSLKNFKFIVMETEMDCPSNRMRIRKIQFLTAEGRVMHIAADPDAPWRSVKTGSLWNDLKGAVCP